MDSSQPPPRRMRRLSFWFGPDNGAVWLAFLIAGLIIVVAVWQAHQSAEQQADRTASRLAVAVAQDVDRSIEQLDLTLRTVIGGDQTPASPSLTQQQRNALLSERTPRDRYLDFIDVLDAGGGVLASLTPRGEPKNWADRDYFEVQRNSPTNDLYVGRPFATEHENRVGFTVSRRIMGRDGKFAGVVVMGVRLASLRDLFGRHEMGPNDSVSLLRDDGVILVRTPFELKDVGHPVEPTTPFYAFTRAGRTSLTASDPIDHSERRLVFHRVGTLPLVVSVATPAQEGYSGLALWWLVPIGVSLGTAFGLLMRRLWREEGGREAAERESREKSRFLTTLSHELRTPLHGVLGYAEQLSKECELSPAQSRQVAEISRAAKHMRDTVNVVLDYARIEALGPALHMRRIVVRELVEDCMAVVRPGAAARGLETRCTVASDAPTHFVTDDAQLRQILVNLLSNAVKYTPYGVVELRLAGDEKHLTIEVVDTGIGIPEGQRHLLFKEYERFGAERTSIEGTGLGLAIAHRLSRRMGGLMGHRNNPGGGSVFWLELPSGVADDATTTSHETDSAPAPGLSILVVDDSDVNREVVEAFLSNAGHRVTVARNGGDAVRLAASQDFDVILMDMLMPGLNGLEATRQIRAFDGSRGQVPIVAVTANALDQHAEECRQAGMSEHLAKPFTQGELLAVIARAAAQRPCAPRFTDAAFDPDYVTQLTACMGADAVERLLDCLALRIEGLLRHLEDPACFTVSDVLGTLAHEVVGSAGTLGFTALASAADRFQSTIVERPAEASGLADEMRRQAVAALAELRRRRALEAMLSA